MLSYGSFSVAAERGWVVNLRASDPEYIWAGFIDKDHSAARPEIQFWMFHAA